MKAGKVKELDFDYYYYYKPNHWELQTVQSVSQLFTQKLCFTIEKQSNSILNSEHASISKIASWSLSGACWRLLAQNDPFSYQKWRPGASLEAGRLAGWLAGRLDAAVRFS